VSACRKPCPGCPWRVDQDATAIPGFRLDLAEQLTRTCGEPGLERPLNAPRFACHLSEEGKRFDCAGWLAAVGYHHLGIRLAVIRGEIPAAALRPDDTWPELHTSYDEVLAKLRESAPDLRSLAVELVDARYGYTCEFAASPDAHRAEYDEVERILTGEGEPA
jgi:Family of unknown function (DUF6283)